MPQDLQKSYYKSMADKGGYYQPKALAAIQTQALQNIQNFAKTNSVTLSNPSALTQSDVVNLISAGVDPQMLAYAGVPVATINSAIQSVQSNAMAIIYASIILKTRLRILKSPMALLNPYLNTILVSSPRKFGNRRVLAEQVTGNKLVSQML